MAKGWSHSVSAGSDTSLGATITDDGVNFALFSAYAHEVELCLFDETGEKETARISLPEKSGDVWHGHVAGLTEGVLYGYRVHGPYAPEEGHRFNHHKLLVDPYARALKGTVKEGKAIYGYTPSRARDADLTFNTLDSAASVPKCVVTADTPFTGERPDVPWTETVIYEAHAKGLTMEREDVEKSIRGTYDALAADAVIDHLLSLGITAIELLPIHAMADEGFLTAKGLTNYWGYNTLNFFVPESRYMGPLGAAGLKAAIEKLHTAGIEVILDVVYNHSCEGSEAGPTLSFRGIDNASYYRLLPDTPRHYINDTGTGNTLNLSHPMVLRLVLDSLRYWVTHFGIDGFRFDLASTLAREETGFDPHGGFLDAIRQDPLLRSKKLIAEPWDVGPGGYQLGAFPYPFREWNDRYRDRVRRFWRGDASAATGMAESLLGSAQTFDHFGRPATSSINFLAAHDGFTLADVTAYAEKHNEANGEDNTDGHNGNHSSNMGHEGPTSDTAINSRRAQRRRNMLASLFLSQGTPMLLAGDEIANSQGGNNNAYCQDNAIGWVNWSEADTALLDFTRKLAAFRKAHPALGQRHFLHGKVNTASDRPDITWQAFAGGEPDWHDEHLQAFAYCLDISAEGAMPEQTEDCLLIAVNGQQKDDILAMPEPPHGKAWQRTIDTAEPDLADAHAPTVTGGFQLVLAQSVVVFLLTDRPPQ